jgi:hypothetical protein
LKLGLALALALALVDEPEPEGDFQRCHHSGYQDLRLVVCRVHCCLQLRCRCFQLRELTALEPVNLMLSEEPDLSDQV